MEEEEGRGMGEEESLSVSSSKGTNPIMLTPPA